MKNMLSAPCCQHGFPKADLADLSAFNSQSDYDRSVWNGLGEVEVAPVDKGDDIIPSDC